MSVSRGIFYVIIKYSRHKEEVLFIFSACTFENIIKNYEVNL